MKATDLMIDDWVLYNETPQQVLEIAGIEDEVYLEEDELVHQSEIQPIPLTPEILEKNGFIKDSDKDNRVGVQYLLVVPTGFERNHFTIQVSLYKEPISGVSTLVKCYGWASPHSGGLNDIHLCSANYVHQLQHALRLCGIEKEITV